MHTNKVFRTAKHVPFIETSTLQSVLISVCPLSTIFITYSCTLIILYMYMRIYTQCMYYMYFLLSQEPVAMVPQILPRGLWRDLFQGMATSIRALSEGLFPELLLVFFLHVCLFTCLFAATGGALPAGLNVHSCACTKNWASLLLCSTQEGEKKGREGEAYLTGMAPPSLSFPPLPFPPFPCCSFFLSPPSISLPLSISIIQLLGYIHQQGHLSGVSAMLLKLYNPFLWRSLKVL